MNDGLNYKDICYKEKVYLIVFGLKMCRAELIITASAGGLELVPGGPTLYCLVWLHPRLSPTRTDFTYSHNHLLYHTKNTDKQLLYSLKMLL